jgi:hypothetical protein
MYSRILNPPSLCFAGGTNIMIKKKSVKTKERRAAGITAVKATTPITTPPCQ